VSHADPIKAAVAVAAGTPLDLFQRLVVSPCSVSALAYTDAGPHVLTVNSTSSLSELAIS
jgi:probable phosphoglycerate mutase